MPHHSFDINHAIKYGHEEAVLIHHIAYWIELNARTGRNFQEEHYWMYQTQEEMASHHPYWNRKQIMRIIKSLIDQGVLVEGHFHKNKFDQTKWYRFKNQEMFTKVQKRTIDCPETDIPISQNGHSECPKTDNPSYIVEDTKEDAKPPPYPPPLKNGGGGSITYMNCKGLSSTVTEGEIFHYFLKHSFATAVVFDAIKIAQQEKAPINDIFKYLEAICKRLANNDKSSHIFTTSSSAPPKIDKNIATKNLGEELYGKKAVKPK